MRVEFNEEFGVSVEDVYDYFRTPMHWRLWESGWRRLRRQAAGRDETSVPETE
jgi:hypothetical protein